MPTPNIYVALLFFSEDPNAIKTRTCYVPAHSSHEAELLLRSEMFELLSRSDVTSYIETDESMQRKQENGCARIHWHQEGAPTDKPMTGHEFRSWLFAYVHSDDNSVYRRALP